MGINFSEIVYNVISSLVYVQWIKEDNQYNCVENCEETFNCETRPEEFGKIKGD
jgi:hypothetical protein